MGIAVESKVAATLGWADDEGESEMSGATRHDLQEWLVDALSAHGGSATIVQVCEHVWANHENGLRAAGDLFLHVAV